MVVRFFSLWCLLANVMLTLARKALTPTGRGRWMRVCGAQPLACSMASSKPSKLASRGAVMVYLFLSNVQIRNGTRDVMALRAFVAATKQQYQNRPCLLKYSR